MSMKKLHSRLEGLFADLERVASSPSSGAQYTLPGWTWECDQNGYFTMCSPEVENVLGVGPSDFLGNPLTRFRLTEDSVTRLETTLSSGSLPIALELEYKSATGKPVSVTLHILNSALESGTADEKWRGFTQVIENRRPIAKPVFESIPRYETSGIASNGEGSFVVPIRVEDQSYGLLEIVNQSPHPHWSEGERRLVEQVADQVSLALENARLFKQTQIALADTEAQAKELALLNEMSRAFSSNLNVDAVLEKIYIYTSRLADTYNFYVALYDEEAQLVSFPLVIADGERVTADHPEWEAWSSSQPVTGLTGHVIETKEPLLIKEDVVAQLNEQQIDYIEVGAGGVSAWLGVPMKIGDRVIGVIAVQSENMPGLYTEHHRDLLTSIGSQAAVAIENARLLDETRRRYEELTALNAISSSASRSLNLEEILDEALQQVLATTSFDAGLISIADRRGQELKLEAHYGMPEDVIQQLEKAGLKGTLCEQTFRRGTVVKLDDISKVAFRGAGSLLGLGFKHYLGIPLESKGKVLGTICAFGLSDDKDPEINLAMMRSIGQQVGVAIVNAQLYEEQRKTAERLRELDKLKSQFLANMSHELRTPLNSIIGFSRVILKGIDGPITELQEQDLTAIYTSGQHLLNMINDILDLSKIEAGKMEITFQEVNLADLIKSVMSTAVGLVKDKPIELYQIIPDDLPVISADPIRVRQVILNLLSNAAKFTNEGSITIKAQQKSSPDGKKEIKITVSDTGPGIAPEDQEKLFQPFSQVDASPTRKTGGSGLGLSISRALVEMHHGQIGLESELEKGSTFYFTLPLEDSIPQGEDNLPPGSNLKVVLAIDSNHKIIEYYRYQLLDHGFEVVPLTDASQAIEQARSMQPFAITLDVLWPAEDGWHILKALKEEPSTRQIPVIICSMLEEKEKGLSMGAEAYLIKPILGEDLVNILQRIKGKN